MALMVLMAPMTLMELMAGNVFAHFASTPSLLFWESVLGRWKQFALPENNFSNTPNTKLHKKVTRHELHYDRRWGRIIFFSTFENFLLICPRIAIQLNRKGLRHARDGIFVIFGWV